MSNYLKVEMPNKIFPANSLHVFIFVSLIYKGLNSSNLFKLTSNVNSFRQNILNIYLI